VVVAIAVLASGCSCGTPGGRGNIPSVKLVMWGVLDDEIVYEQIIKNYKEYVRDTVNIDIEYVKKDFAEYERESLNALAAGKGPDIWMIRNDEVYAHADKLIPMPEGYIKRTKNDNRTDTQVYASLFPQVAVQDNIIDNNIYGIPFSIDTLAVYYNTEHFSRTLNKLYEQNRENEANLFALPPNTWEEFLKMAELLTQRDNQGNITRSGVAMGTAKNVEHAGDILAAMMIQNQAKMTSADLLTATFNLPITKDTGEPSYAGTQALNFYTSFADPSKKNYTYNTNMPNSVDAFIQGRASMMIHYGYIRKRLEQEAPSMRYNIGALPQISGSTSSIDFASYWTNTVTNNSENPEQAWDFIKYIFEQELNTYLSATKKPTSRRTSDFYIPLTKERNVHSNPFLYQIETAQYWYRGKYPVKVANAFYQMIEDVVINKQPVQKSIDKGASTVTELYKASIGRPTLDDEIDANR
jgi:ABC-type glycerol-3-phosphate transport system substrate-binding protein